jgi:hypothetical protein
MSIPYAQKVKILQQVQQQGGGHTMAAKHVFEYVCASKYH